MNAIIATITSATVNTKNMRFTITHLLFLLPNKQIMHERRLPRQAWP
jgi:hypothetical protein